MPRRQPIQILVLPFRLDARGQIEVAVLRRAEPPMWQFVSGGVEEGESLEEAAARELFEELGIRDVPLMKLDAHACVPAAALGGHRVQWPEDLFVVPERCFAVALPAGAALRLSAEHDEARWVSPAQATGLLTWDSNRVALQELCERLDRGQLTEEGGGTDSRPYRENVAALLKRGPMILLGQRIEPDYHWQLPQGGVDAGETHEEAVVRELGEELGLLDAASCCRLLARSQPICYEFPWGDERPVSRKYRGQRQTVFLFDFEGDDGQFCLDRHQVPEFRQAAWFTPEQALAVFWDFKRPVIEEALRAFVPWFSGGRDGM